MARKQPVGYVVRRPLTLWGKSREIGEYIPASEVASLARVESMVRSGRFKVVYEETDRGTVVKGRTNKRDNVVLIDSPKKPRKPKPKAEEPVVVPDEVYVVEEFTLGEPEEDQ